MIGLEACSTIQYLGRIKHVDLPPFLPQPQSNKA